MVHVMSKSPLSIVKERFGDDPKKAKEQLVAAVKKVAGKDLWLDRLNEEKGLQHVSNSKLLHLEQVFEAVGKAVGSRDKLIGEIAKASGPREGCGLHHSSGRGVDSKLVGSVPVCTIQLCRLVRIELKHRLGMAPCRLHSERVDHE